MGPWTRFIYNVLTQPRHTQWIGPLLILGDAALCALVVWKISYTEIDWTTYMQQVKLFIDGERNYPSIQGSTGPLVYPAGHVYVYTLLYHLTDQGRDILLGQIIFAGIYLATLAIVVACYRQVLAPPYLFPLLALSKRLHSIYMLRMFNDGIAAFFMWAAIYLWMKRKPLAGVMVWSLGVSVKMTLVLLVPAIAVITVYDSGLTGGLAQAIVAFQPQMLLAKPFTRKDAIGYLTRSFELTRKFMFKWTVNWRFVGEETFLSKEFSLGLLALHVSLLGIFSTVWSKPSNMNVFNFAQRLLRGWKPRIILSKTFIMQAMLSSLAIGMLCARSLHYQFFAYLAWATPYLLWQANFHPILIYVIWAVQEWAWNVYPSTNISSAAVVVSLTLQVFGVFISGLGEVDNGRRNVDDRTYGRSQ
ncbi:hypothetical protein N7532_005466 [Penicillium argentinense]|uniref:Dol-P-Man:Man(5)GlcNAc(2)-PP-Dol alpha-1,3-mannosyltransferase n=1 Tax=Penicillium argentinense TaxID=1131581 RepID=A0A9W9FDZ1_9EURO|nr:uncharacterized protein N7532_005466 [Penicillium argentinense]KAJ5098465.1 hypothetical protein N7532_005466 [Penicillium argentinense]